MSIADAVDLILYLIMCIVLVFRYRKILVPEVRAVMSVIPPFCVVLAALWGLEDGIEMLMKHYILFLGMTLMSIAYLYVIRYIRENTEKEKASAKQKVSATNKSNKTYKNEE